MRTLLSLIVGLFVIAQSFTFLSEKESRILGNFTDLEVAGNIIVTLIPSSENKADITILKGEIDDLITEVSGNTLEIKFKKTGKKWNNSGNKKADIKLYFTELKEIDISAGARISGNDVIKAASFELEASSGSSCSIQLETTKLEVNVSSGASVTLKGMATKQNVDISSGASYKAGKLETEMTTIEVSSGGSGTVWATKEFVADASSGGNVKYKGEPKKTNIDAGKFSGGSIRAM